MAWDRRPKQSIKIQWQGMTPKGHRMKVTMFPRAQDEEHVRKHPEASWAEHPELRSSGLIPDPDE
jgi:hypothetical protein